MKKLDYVNPWTYNGKRFDSDQIGKHFGFVYCITDTQTGLKYIGKKHFYSLRKVKGKTNRVRKESDWKRYYSSHDELKKMGKAEPMRFVREILHLCKNLGETNWREIEEQFLRGVLHSSKYMNDNINGKWFKKNVSRYYLKEREELEDIMPALVKQPSHKPFKGT